MGKAPYRRTGQARAMGRAAVSQRCALCGRLTLHPAVLIGAYPVGAKCARRAGLLPSAKKRMGMVVRVVERQIVPKDDTRTLDLFAGEA